MMLSPPSCRARPPFPASAEVEAIIRLALAEDVGRGDLTTEATVAPDAIATAEILQKAPRRHVRPARSSRRSSRRSTRASASRDWLRKARSASGAPSRASRVRRASILTGERTALNFLQRLSGVATRQPPRRGARRRARTRG